MAQPSPTGSNGPTPTTASSTGPLKLKLKFGGGPTSLNGSSNRQNNNSTTTGTSNSNSNSNASIHPTPPNSTNINASTNHQGTSLSMRLPSHPRSNPNSTPAGSPSLAAAADEGDEANEDAYEGDVQREATGPSTETTAGKKRRKSSGTVPARKRVLGSVTAGEDRNPAGTTDAPSASPSTTPQPQTQRAPQAAIGSIVLPPQSSEGPKRVVKRRKKDPNAQGAAAAAGGAAVSADEAAGGSPSASGSGATKTAGTSGTGLGRGWRKGLKGYTRREGGPPSNGRSPGSTSAAGPIGVMKRRSKAIASITEDAFDDAAPDTSKDAGGDFVPAMVASSGLATTDKWPSGLPGGNEQSRATAAMASAVNKAFPVGPIPKTGSGFLGALPLDKNTPRPRSWKKEKREIIGPSGIPFYLPVYIGGSDSGFAGWLAENPRPVQLDKKGNPIVPEVAGSGDTPGPEATPSEGDASGLFTKEGSSTPASGPPTAPVRDPRYPNRGRGRGMPGHKRKSGGPGSRKARLAEIAAQKAAAAAEAEAAAAALAAQNEEAEGEESMMTTAAAAEPGVEERTARQSLDPDAPATSADTPLTPTAPGSDTSMVVDA